jgi:hypothetical protein
VNQKHCPACDSDLTEYDFYVDRRRKDGRYTICKRCHKKRVEIWKQEHKGDNTRYKHTSKKNKQAKLRILIAELKSVPCADCGVQYSSYVMDFDHVRGKKLFDISTIVHSTKGTEEKIRAEAAKCDIVCSNCHRKRTYDVPQSTCWHCNSSRVGVCIRHG